LQEQQLECPLLVAGYDDDDGIGGGKKVGRGGPGLYWLDTVGALRKQR